MPIIQFRTKEIYYNVEGSGFPVMLLHGFGEDGTIWNHQIEKLKKNYKVIIPDLPGSGKSELLDGYNTLEDYAEVIKMIADQELKQRKSNGTFSLVGHSMGGYITLTFAKKYSQLLNSFGLFHSSAFADSAEKITTREKGIEFINKNGAELYAETTVPNLFSELTRLNHPEFVKDLVTLASKLSPEALIQYTHAMIQRVDTTEVLKTFPKPILFIIGIHDNAVPLDASLKQCHLPSNVTVHFLQKSGHIGMWEEKELSTHYLNSFLNSFAYFNK